MSERLVKRAAFARGYPVEQVDDPLLVLDGHRVELALAFRCETHVVRTAVTGNPPVRSLFAYTPPSSRSTSASPVMTSASGGPTSCSTVARSGEAVISACCLSSVVYRSKNHCIASRRRK